MGSYVALQRLHDVGFQGPVDQVVDIHEMVVEGASTYAAFPAQGQNRDRRKIAVFSHLLDCLGKLLFHKIFFHGQSSPTGKSASLPRRPAELHAAADTEKEKTERLNPIIKNRKAEYNGRRKPYWEEIFRLRDTMPYTDRSPFHVQLMDRLTTGVNCILLFSL